MENQHNLIKGYRDLSQKEIDLMNRIKEQGVALQNLLETVETHINEQYDDDNDWGRLFDANPTVWMMDAKKDLQVGIMKLIRAVEQPTSF